MNKLTPITVKLTPREKEQVSQMADLHNSYLSDILRWGIEKMWEQYSYEAEVMAEERAAIAQRLEGDSE